jgi:hypothetical protein
MELERRPPFSHASKYSDPWYHFTTFTSPGHGSSIFLFWEYSEIPLLENIRLTIFYLPVVDRVFLVSMVLSYRFSDQFSSLSSTLKNVRVLQSSKCLEEKPTCETNCKKLHFWIISQKSASGCDQQWEKFTRKKTFGGMPFSEPTSNSMILFRMIFHSCYVIPSCFHKSGEFLWPTKRSDRKSSLDKIFDSRAQGATDVSKHMNYDISAL